MKNNIKNQINKNNQKGFTLLETLVAIFILTLSITGPVYVASLAFRNTIDSRDNISAQYIAEEVIEVIKNKKDQKGLADPNISAWLDNITDDANCLNIGNEIVNKCVMNRDVTEPDFYSFEECPEECPNISFDPENPNAVYGYKDVLTSSKFVREFYLQESSVNPNEIYVIVNIKWTDKGNPKMYSLKENLHAIPYKDFFK